MSSHAPSADPSTAIASSPAGSGSSVPATPGTIATPRSAAQVARVPACTSTVSGVTSWPITSIVGESMPGSTHGTGDFVHVSGFRRRGNILSGRNERRTRYKWAREAPRAAHLEVP